MKRKQWAAWALAVLLVGATPTSVFAAWYDNNILVAHCLGEAEGKIETNSKEAFVSSWENGFRAFEADFTYTSDGVLVVRHDFEADGSYYRLEQQTRTELEMNSVVYNQSKIVYEQTPMTAADLLSLLNEYPDAYLITDTKNTDQETVQRQFKDLVKIAENLGNPDVLNRIVPQIYNQEMIGWVKEVYDFPEWIFTLYQAENMNYSEIAAFCVENNIGTVTIEKELVTSDMVNVMHDKNIRVYAHTVNRYLNLSELLSMGVNGVYTDRIKPYELSWVNRSNPRSLTSVTAKVHDESVLFKGMRIFNEMYVPLRDFATLGDGFSAQYNPLTKTISLESGGTFSQLGNEILMDKSNKFITQKSDMKLVYDGADTGLTLFLVDGEVYVHLEKMTEILERSDVNEEV